MHELTPPIDATQIRPGPRGYSGPKLVRHLVRPAQVQAVEYFRG